MPTSLVLTVIGNDQPGLVESLSKTIADHDGSWMESRMAHLAGKFAGILLVDVPTSRVDALTVALLAEDSQGLSIVVEKAPTEESAEPCRPLNLHLLGQDRPGIVHEVSQALMRAKANIEELETEVVDATMSGETLFKAEVKLSVPLSVPADDLRDVLEALADELMVDITLDETPAAAEG